jgi:putative ABC transport system permease protein
MGLTLASLLITQQLAIFFGLMSRSYGAITDMAYPDIWVMDPKVQFIDDVKPLQDTELDRVRGVAGVEWATPLYKGIIQARLSNGLFQSCNVWGLDDASLVGGPPTMVTGQLQDLRRSDSVIVDQVGAEDKLAHIAADGKTKIPLKVGDEMELNDHRAVVVGICQNTRTWQSQPIVYTTYSRATIFAPTQRKLLSFVLVKAGLARTSNSCATASRNRPAWRLSPATDSSRKPTTISCTTRAFRSISEFRYCWVSSLGPPSRGRLFIVSLWTTSNISGR